MTEIDAKRDKTVYNEHGQIMSGDLGIFCKVHSKVELLAQHYCTLSEITREKRYSKAEFCK